MLGSDGIPDLQKFVKTKLTPLQQPSRFRIEWSTLGETFDTPALIQSLAQYSESILSSSEDSETPLSTTQDMDKSTKSILFIRFWSAADYFTLNDTLMQSPQPVHVDLSTVIASLPAACCTDGMSSTRSIHPQCSPGISCADYCIHRCSNRCGVASLPELLELALVDPLSKGTLRMIELYARTSNSGLRY